MDVPTDAILQYILLQYETNHVVVPRTCPAPLSIEKTQKNFKESFFAMAKVH